MSEQQPPDVGSKVRAWRQERGLSLRALAELCDLSPNTISLIERGSTSPCVSTLHRLATALQVPIASFFVAEEKKVEVLLSRPGERLFSGSTDVLLESLGSGLEGQTLEAFVVTLKPNADSGKQQPMVHEGHELVYCLEGEIEYRVKDRSYRLGRGESLLFEARLPHCWQNRNCEPAVFLLVFQSAVTGESLEEHLRSHTESISKTAQWREGSALQHDPNSKGIPRE